VGLARGCRLFRGLSVPATACGFAATGTWIGPVAEFSPSHDHQAAVQMPTVTAMPAAMTTLRGLIQRCPRAGGGFAMTLGADVTVSALIA